MKKKVIKSVANIAKCGVGAFTILGLNGCQDDNIQRKCSDEYIKFATPSMVEECKEHYEKKTSGNPSGSHNSGVPAWLMMYMMNNNNNSAVRSNGYFSSSTVESIPRSGGSSHGSSSGG